LRARQLRAITFELRLRLLKGRLKWPWVNLKQQIAFFDELTFLEICGINDSLNPRGDLHGCIRNDRSRRASYDCKIAATGFTDTHGRRRSSFGLRRRDRDNDRGF